MTEHLPFYLSPASEPGSVATGDPILDGMARALWTTVWQQAAGIEAGVTAPPTPLAAVIDAARLAGALEGINDAGIWTLYHRAIEAILDDRGLVGSMSHRREAPFNALLADQSLAQRFGADLMIEATGNGPGWFSWQPAFDLTMPTRFFVDRTMAAADALVRSAGEITVADGLSRQRCVVTDSRVFLHLTADETADWADTPGKCWPGSQIAGRTLDVEFDRNGLVDFTLDGESVDVPAEELNAITSDFLKDEVPEEHSCWLVCVGQFVDDTVTPAPRLR